MNSVKIFQYYDRNSIYNIDALHLFYKKPQVNIYFRIVNMNYFTLVAIVLRMLGNGQWYTNETYCL